jgi:hypothetical protein
MNSSSDAENGLWSAFATSLFFRKKNSEKQRQNSEPLAVIRVPDHAETEVFRQK